MCPSLQRLGLPTGPLLRPQVSSSDRGETFGRSPGRSLRTSGHLPQRIRPRALASTVSWRGWRSTHTWLNSQPFHLLQQGSRERSLEGKFALNPPEVFGGPFEAVQLAKRRISKVQTASKCPHELAFWGLPGVLPSFATEILSSFMELTIRRTPLRSRSRAEGDKVTAARMLSQRFASSLESFVGDAWPAAWLAELSETPSRASRHRKYRQMPRSRGPQRCGSQCSKGTAD
jgi:hypothetical protein